MSRLELSELVDTAAPAPTCAQSPIEQPGRTDEPMPMSAPWPTVTLPARWAPGATWAKSPTKQS